MIRCPQCGTRLSDAQPVCRLHGTPAASTPTTSNGGDAVATDAKGESGGSANAFVAEGYRIEGLLGRGGFGSVYLAVRVSDGREVAIKAVDPEQATATRQLVREAEALRRLGAPHVPEVYETGTSSGRFYVVMEKVEGATLADELVKQAGPMPLASFGRVASALLESLEAVHAGRLVHRDLKPENVFLLGGVGEESMSVKLIDFGLVQIDGALLAEDEASMGTAEYMSPEQCEGKVDADARADVYAVGVLLYEMLTGAPPFWGKAADVKQAQIARRPPRWPPALEVPEEVGDVVLKCLSKEPQRRYADARELRAALRGALGRPSVRRVSRPSPAAAPASVSGPSAVKAPAPAREKRTVSLLYFQSSAGLPAVQSALTALGGHLAQTDGSQYVVVFGHEVDDNPVRRAILAAQELATRVGCAAALVDVGEVSLQVRPDGTRRFLSALFSRKERFPRAGETGVLLTAAASQLVPDMGVSSLPNREGVFQVVKREALSETTRTWKQGDALVGRSDIVRMLVTTATRAASTPTLVSVWGEAGYGKSHLAHAVAEELERSEIRAEVVRTKGEEAIGGASPMVRGLLTHCLGVSPQAPEDGGKELLQEKLGAVGPQVWAAAALMLGWVTLDQREVRVLSAAPGALRAASSRALGEALRRRARRAPLLLLVDDAHLADDTTLDALEYATLKEAGAPVWVCVFARPTFEKGRPTWGLRSGLSERHELGALADGDAAEMARRLLYPAEHIPQTVLARLVERTQGVPGLLAELVGGLKREGLIHRTLRGSQYYVATEELDRLPDLPIVQWAASRQVETLPVELASHARLASVLGSGFTVAEIDTVLQILERIHPVTDVPLDSSVAVERLTKSGLLVVHRTGKIDFRNDLLRETVYRSVPSALRDAAHRAAYEAYRDHLDSSSAEGAVRLALHAAKSGMKKEAAATYMGLAQQANKRQAYLEAELMYTRALENLEDDEHALICSARQGRALIRLRLSRYDDSGKDLVLAREHARKLGDLEKEIELLIDEATAADWMFEFARSSALVAQAQEAAGTLKAPSRLIEARLLMGRGLVFNRLKKPEQSIELTLQAADVAEPLGDAGYETYIVALSLAGFDAGILGRIDEAERIIARGIEAAEGRGDVLHSAVFLINRTLVRYARNDPEGFFRDHERCLRMARDAGLNVIEFGALANLGETAYLVEKLEEATEHTLRCIDLTARMWGADSAGTSGRELLLCRIHLYTGQPEEARTLVEKLQRRLASLRVAGKVEDLLSPGEETMLAMADLSTRDATGEEWDALVARAETTNPQVQERMEVLEMRAIGEAARGEIDRARTHLGTALELGPTQIIGRRIAARFQRLGMSRG